VVKVLVAVLGVALLALALGCDRTRQDSVNLTQCERDCINDSGGKGWCADYCKKHSTYGPPKK
jgi:hypothetical protein